MAEVAAVSNSPNEKGLLLAAPAGSTPGLTCRAIGKRYHRRCVSFRRHGRDGLRLLGMPATERHQRMKLLKMFSRHVMNAA